MEKILSSPFVKTQVFHHHWLKRLFDLFFSLFALALLSPLFLVISLAIRISSPGRAIYTQKRIGKGGKVFTCYKFRTMHLNADRKLDKVLKGNPNLKLEWTNHQKLRHDPRIFSLGSFLRKFSLDELPQFWNVVKGDLSVVGPRPYMVHQRRELVPKILTIRPGITGLWQTSGRSKTTFQKRVELDATYIDCMSFWLDLRLIAKTIPQVLLAKDAF